MPTLAQGGQSVIQPRILPLYAIAEDMEFTIANAGADFHAGNDFNSQLCAGCYGLGNAGHNVVVRNGQCSDLCFVSESYHLNRRETSIGVGRMEMEIDATHVDSCGRLVRPACWATSCAVKTDSGPWLPSCSPSSYDNTRRLDVSRSNSLCARQNSHRRGWRWRK